MFWWWRKLPKNAVSIAKNTCRRYIFSIFVFTLFFCIKKNSHLYADIYIYMYCTCTVHVQYMYSTCTVHSIFLRSLVNIYVHVILCSHTCAHFLWINNSLKVSGQCKKIWEKWNAMAERFSASDLCSDGRVVRMWVRIPIVNVMLVSPSETLNYNCLGLFTQECKWGPVRAEMVIRCSSATARTPLDIVRFFLVLLLLLLPETCPEPKTYTVHVYM